MKKIIRNIATPAMFAFALLTTSAWAQTTAAPASASSSAPATGHHGQKRADIVEQRISDLHSQLNITADQSKQWDAFAQTMRDNARKTGQAFHDRSSKLSTMNADESMKSYAALAQEHAENMQKLSSAMSDLYAVLTPEQKETADALYRNQTPKRHHGHGTHKHKDGAPASASSAG
ncbi:MAG TPA: Spy/CpxP family protein refolding chaperone [Rhodanobacter sp.]